MSNDAEYSFYGMLYVDAGNKAHVNLKSCGVDPVDTYIKCAALCARSMAANGYRFRLVTNHAGELRRRAAGLGLRNLEIVAHEFKWAVPSGIPFYAAHFKLELLEAFGAGRYGPRVALIDIDTVLCRPFVLPFLPPGALLAYDISDQVFPEHGRTRVKEDLERVAGAGFRDIRWFGGEFLLGDAAAFRRLSEYLHRCWPRYQNALTGLHHLGDEMIVSAALNIAAHNGQTVIDAGAASSVARWWSARTRFRQHSFRHIGNRSLIHLPADKPFLARYAAEPFDGNLFLSAYEKHAGKKLMIRRIYNVLAGLSGRTKKFVGVIERTPVLRSESFPV